MFTDTTHDHQVLSMDRLAALLDLTTERCAAAWAQYHADIEKAKGLKEQLGATLSPEAYRAAIEIIDADTASSTSFLFAMVAEIGRHYPMIAPVLPGLLEHVMHTSPGVDGDGARCCVHAETERGYW